MDQQQQPAAPQTPAQPQAQNATPSAPQAHPHEKVYFMILGVVILLVAAGALAYWQKNHPGTNASVSVHNSSSSVAEQNNSASPLQPSEPTATATPIAIDATIIPCQPLPPNLHSKSGLVQWQQGQSLDDLHLVDTTSSTPDYDNASYTQVGTILSGKYAGGVLILAELTPHYDEADGPVFNSEIEIDHIVKFNGQYIILEKYSDKSQFIASKASKDTDFTLPDLEYSKTIPLASSSMNLVLTNGGKGSCINGLVKVFTDPVYGDIYTDQFATTPKTDLGSGIISPDYGFYAIAPDGTGRTYALNIDFIGNDNVPFVTWNKDGKNTKEYSYTDHTGCGSYNFASVMPADQVSDADLTQTGVTATGQAVYEFKDANNTHLKDFYDKEYYPVNGENKIAYSDFTLLHPVFFWKDPIGRFIKFQRSDFLPLAECGKPVIYLYPQKTEKVSVQIDPQGGMTISDPLYNGGWNVIADPQSNLTDLYSGKQYPYLFWEGRGGLYQTPDRGFVVAKQDVHAFLLEKLHMLGLNDKETADFMEFWEPRMQSSPYYFVTFMGNRTMDELAPLTVTPKPDTVIRVLMDFKPLEAPISVQGYTIHTPERKGFTVVEWGGVLRNDKN